MTVTPVCEHLQRKLFNELFVNILESTENSLQCKRTNITHIFMVYGNASGELVVYC